MKFRTEHVTHFLSKHIFKVAIDEKFTPDSINKFCTLHQISKETQKRRSDTNWEESEGQTEQLSSLV